MIQSSLSLSVFSLFFYNKEKSTLKHLCLPVNRWWLFFLSLSARSWSFLALFLDSGHSLVLMFFTPCLLSGFRNTTMGYHWGIVQPIHCVRSNVQHCMFFLQNTYKDASSWFHGLSSVRLYNMMYHNPPAGGSSAIQIECVHSCIAFCAFVCVKSYPVDYLLIVWRRMIPEPRLSVPASLGSLSTQEKT